jgi:hypothetical protein
VRTGNKTDRSILHRSRPVLRSASRRLVTLVSCAALLIGTAPAPLQAQAPAATQPYSVAQPAPAAQPSATAQPADAQGYSVEQLDALLAPIALYPDQLLTQILMAATFPLQVVEAARWVADPANKALTGDALAAALAQQTWDPSVKSLVPFPQVLAMMNSKLDWLQQLGYAVSVQQSAVMDSVQRLRHQAQAAGQCQTTAQQVVSSVAPDIVITPAQPDVVYVPVYDPSVVYGGWPYPLYPPVYLEPPPWYYGGPVLGIGLVFGVGIPVFGGLWGWARPNWRGRGFYLDVNRYNRINVNRPPIRDPGWRSPGRPGGGFRPPETGPVGRPARSGGCRRMGSAGRTSRCPAGPSARPPAWDPAIVRQSAKPTGPAARHSVRPHGPVAARRSSQPPVPAAARRSVRPPVPAAARRSVRPPVPAAARRSVRARGPVAAVPRHSAVSMRAGQRRSSKAAAPRVDSR